MKFDRKNCFNFLNICYLLCQQMVKKLRTVYAHPDDVDLIIGGMAERSAEDGLLGPTFRCLIFEQFSRTRRTDRYFYNSAYQPHPFTPGKKQFFSN